MIILYTQNELGVRPMEVNNENSHLLSDALWIDLLSPTLDEEQMIEKHLGLEVPTKKEMAEIESSSRLYIENDSLFMTATMVAKSDSDDPETDSVTFILAKNKLITVRYIEPTSFKIFISQLSRVRKSSHNAEEILVGLFEATTDRLADVLENVSYHFDKISRMIFHSRDKNESETKIDYKNVLQNIGANGDLGAKVRVSLVSFIRMISFLEQHAGSRLSTDLRSRLIVVNRDINSLSDYAGFVSTKTSLLVDATLGMVNIEQNNIIKIFSVAAVIFLPPTLIASIYGMNFQVMPELHTRFGYPISICLMLISAWLPYRYFKQKKWL